MEQTIISQNPHWGGRPYKGLHDRELLGSLLRKKEMPHIQILTGVRRCGKSTLFKLLINDLLNSGASPKSILNLNLDAPVFIPVWSDASKIAKLVEIAETLTGERVKYLFLDEVQQVENWESYVKSAYDNNLFDKIYITGSNSNLLQSKFASRLSGRYFENTVRPFSIKECLHTMGINSLLEAYQAVPQVIKCLNRILKFGAFPEIFLTSAGDDIKQELLHSYLESIVQKDCIVYNSIREAKLFYKTVNYLLQNVGRRFSAGGLGKTLNSNENTMASYINYLCEAYICADVRNFSYSLKEAKRSEHKCYCVDNGLMYANTFRYTSDDGSFLENLVFNELVNQGYKAISFDNQTKECDFLASKDGQIHAFQVCYELSDNNRKREANGFNLPQIPIASKTLITYNQKEQIADIQVVPIWEWAMGAQ